MKVTYDFQIFLKQRHGGISRYFFELAKQIKGMQGADARIFAPFYVNHYLKSGGSHRGVYLKKYPALAQPCVEMASRLLSRVDIAMRAPHILHETYYGVQKLAPAATQTVTTVYDLIHAKFPELYPGDETPRLQATAVKRADHIFCISKKTQDDLVEILGVERSRTSVTHLGCDFHLRQKDVKENPLSAPYLLFVGPRGKHKNFQVLAEAYAGSERLRRDFKIVCFGSTSFSEEEMAMHRRLGLSTDQILHVSGEDDLLPTYYAHAQAFVYPSLYEGFGFPPLEAMSLGCPTISSDAGSMPEVLADATEYFSSGNMESLRHSLEKVLYSTENRAALSRAGLERSGEFTWEKCAHETFAEYKKLL